MMWLFITWDSQQIDWYFEHSEERMEPNTKPDHKKGK